MNASSNRLPSASSVAIWRFSSDEDRLSESAVFADAERDGECEDVREVVDVEGTGVEGEPVVLFRRKEDGGVTGPVWRRRRDRYGLPRSLFPPTLILLVLIFALKYCTSPACDRFSDVRETSLRMYDGGIGRRDVPPEKMDVSSVVAVRLV